MKILKAMKVVIGSFIGKGTSGGVLYVDNNTTLAQDADLIFDGTNLSIVAPTSNLHAATKKYVDDQILHGDVNFSYETIASDITIPVNQQMIVDNELTINEAELGITGELSVIFDDNQDNFNYYEIRESMSVKIDLYQAMHVYDELTLSDDGSLIVDGRLIYV